MKRITVMLFVFLLSACSFAALPPQHRNSSDLNIMIDFVKSHKKVMATLRSIDLEKFVVRYSDSYRGDECVASFGREAAPEMPEGQPRPVGPKQSLEFKSSTCSVDWK